MNERKINERLRSVYEDPAHPAGLGSAAKLYAAARKRGWKDISKNDVMSFLLRNRSYTIHADARHRFRRNKIISYGINYLAQCDLAQMDTLARWNDGVRFLLVYVDVFSRLVSVEPLKNKRGDETARALERIFDRRNGAPMLLQSDLGSEFWNDYVHRLLAKTNTQHIPAKNIVKASMAEGRIRILKNKIHRYMTDRDTKRYVDRLSDFETAMNRTYIKTIGMRPIDVNYNRQATVFHKLFPELYDAIGRPKQTLLKIGNFVRISRRRVPFAKAFRGNFSTKVYRVKRIHSSDPPRYTVDDPEDDLELEGTFYAAELQRVIRQRT